jgi:GT2 family glycosyltransferase
MTGPAEVGVVVASRDRRRSLLRTLAELRQLPEQPPIVVVDNGSRDGSAEAVTRDFPEVELLALGRNRGAFARTLGARRLRTPLVAFCDDDSWWQPGALVTAAGTFRRFPRLGLLAARILVGPERRLDPVSALMAAGPAAPGLPGPRVRGFLACGAVMRRAAFLAAGGFAERFLIGSEEELVAIDLRWAGWDLCYCERVVARHIPDRGDRGSRSQLSLRNALWTSWLRMPAAVALADTAALARLGGRDPSARRALLGGIRGIPWILRSRRRVPGWLLHEWGRSTTLNVGSAQRYAGEAWVPWRRRVKTRRERHDARAQGAIDSKPGQTAP